MLGWFKGKRTYITGIGMMLYGVWQYAVEGNQGQGAQTFLTGIGMMTLRAGVRRDTGK